MAKTLALDIARQLADKVHAIRLNASIAAWNGTTSRESQLLAFRKAAAEVVVAIGAEKSYQEIIEKFKALVSQIDTGGLTGLISESEITEYYALVDKLWASIEKENK